MFSISQENGINYRDFEFIYLITCLFITFKGESEASRFWYFHIFSFLLTGGF